MKTALLHPSYFGSIAQYIALVKSDTIVFENFDNYQKQTYRNRTNIYGANGKLVLNVPILHTKKGIKQLYKDIEIEHQFNTIKTHWKSLESAYRTSPYFEFYEDDLAPLFEVKHKYLLDFNYKCMAFVWEALQINPQFSKSENYISNAEDFEDYRYLSNPKDAKIGANFEPYIQVFGDKYGFIPNLSILDLLFNLGPSALDYLEKQSI